MAFGGAGPTQAALLAEEARLDGIVVPLAPGTFCAYGAIQSAVRRDYVRSLRVGLNQGAAAMAAIGDALAQMRSEALAWIAQEGRRLAEPVIEGSADVRYAGQAYDLQLLFSAGATSESAVQLAARFHALHAQIYGFPDRDSEVEVMTVRLSAARALPRVRPVPLARATAPLKAQGERHLHLREQTFTAPVYARASLRPGHELEGPAIIEQSDTTVCVLPLWQARVHDDGTLLLNRRKASTTNEGSR